MSHLNSQLGTTDKVEKNLALGLIVEDNRVKRPGNCNYLFIYTRVESIGSKLTEFSSAIEKCSSFKAKTSKAKDVYIYNPKVL